MSISASRLKDSKPFTFDADRGNVAAGFPSITQLGTSGMYGVSLPTAGTSFIDWLVTRPRLWDPAKKWKFRCVWSSTTAAQSTALIMRWTLSLYGPMGDGEAIGSSLLAKEGNDTSDALITGYLTDATKPFIMVTPWSPKFKSLASYGWTKDKDQFMLKIVNNVATTVVAPWLKSIQIAVD